MEKKTGAEEVHVIAPLTTQINNDPSFFLKVLSFAHWLDCKPNHLKNSHLIDVCNTGPTHVRTAPLDEFL